MTVLAKTEKIDQRRCLFSGKSEKPVNCAHTRCGNVGREFSRHAVNISLGMAILATTIRDHTIIALGMIRRDTALVPKNK